MKDKRLIGIQWLWRSQFKDSEKFLDSLNSSQISSVAFELPSNIFYKEVNEWLIENTCQGGALLQRMIVNNLKVT